MDEITVLSSNFPRDKNVKLYFQVYKNKNKKTLPTGTVPNFIIQLFMLLLLVFDFLWMILFIFRC